MDVKALQTFNEEGKLYMEEGDHITVIDGRLEQVAVFMNMNYALFRTKWFLSTSKHDQFFELKKVLCKCIFLRFYAVLNVFVIEEIRGSRFF